MDNQKYNKVKKGRGYLTDKQMSFVDMYIKYNGNGHKAWKESLYRSATKTDVYINTRVKRLLAHPVVSAEITKRLESIKEKNMVDAEHLITKLLQIIETEQDRNPNAAIKAIELAGKAIALWKDRQELTGANGDAIKTEQVSADAQDFTNRLAALAARKATKSDTPEPPTKH